MEKELVFWCACSLCKITIDDEKLDFSIIKGFLKIDRIVSHTSQGKKGLGSWLQGDRVTQGNRVTRLQHCRVDTRITSGIVTTSKEVWHSFINRS